MNRRLDALVALPPRKHLPFSPAVGLGGDPEPVWTIKREKSLTVQQMGLWILGLPTGSLGTVWILICYFLCESFPEIESWTF